MSWFIYFFDLVGDESVFVDEEGVDGVLEKTVITRRNRMQREGKRWNE
jgi:hypothetical protein